VTVPTITESEQEKEALKIAGEVLKAIEEEATENAQNAIESLNGKDGSTAKPTSPDGKNSQVSTPEGNGDSQNNALWLLLLLVIVILGSSIVIRKSLRTK
jgi:hypothetical protein